MITAMMMMAKMGGLEGTNRLRGRVERPITPLHTSNPKPTLWSNLDGCAQQYIVVLKWILANQKQYTQHTYYPEEKPNSLHPLSHLLTQILGDPPINGIPAPNRRPWSRHLNLAQTFKKKLNLFLGDYSENGNMSTHQEFLPLQEVSFLLLAGKPEG